LNDGSEIKYNKPVTGDVVSFNADTLTLRRYNFETTSYLYDNISIIELSTERKDNTRKGAIIGAIIGASLGAGFGLAILAIKGGRNLPLDPYGNEPSGYVIIGGMTFLGGFIGFFPGVIIGKLASSETWEKIPVENIRRRQISFSYQGIMVGFSFRLRR